MSGIYNSHLKAILLSFHLKFWPPTHHMGQLIPAPKNVMHGGLKKSSSEKNLWHPLVSIHTETQMATVKGTE